MAITPRVWIPTDHLRSLHAMVKEGWPDATRVGKEAGWFAKKVRRHMNILFGSGVVRRIHVEADPKAFGYEIEAVAFVVLKGQPQDNMQRKVEVELAKIHDVTQALRMANHKSRNSYEKRIHQIVRFNARDKTHRNEILQKIRAISHVERVDFKEIIHVGFNDPGVSTDAIEEEINRRGLTDHD